MTRSSDDTIFPEHGKRLPLAEPVERARVLLQQAIEELKKFKADTTYPLVTRNEAAEAITSIRLAEEKISRLDPPFQKKTAGKPSNQE